MTTTLQLALLGKPEISLAGVPLARLKYQKSLALLVYLAVTGRPHSREALAGLLWGESTEANARASLRKSLAELRARVGDHLIIERRQVAFNREAAYSLDVEDFEAPIERFRTRTGADLHPEEAGALALALDAYQGDFLAGFYVRRAAAFKEWAALHRERFWLMALRGLHTLANHYLTRGDYPQAIGHIERLLALEPYQEEAHRQLISLLALDGRRGAALRQYETCRRLLRAELGIEPQAEATALYHRIKDQSAPDAQPRGQHRPLPALRRGWEPAGA
ncbi:MAG: BTAD domain-containing putative transcriptional regulator, partial [Anaerolineales bacterium]